MVPHHFLTSVLADELSLSSSLVQRYDNVVNNDVVSDVDDVGDEILIATVGGDVASVSRRTGEILWSRSSSDDDDRRDDCGRRHNTDNDNEGVIRLFAPLVLTAEGQRVRPFRRDSYRLSHRLVRGSTRAAVALHARP